MFWLTTAFTVLVIAIVVLVDPPTSTQRHRDDRLARRGRPGGGAVGGPAGDHPGAVVGLDVAGARSAARAGGVVVLVGWWLWERRAKQPLVSTAMLARRPILLTNLATVFVGMGLYFAFLGLTQFVQIPREAAGYGFGATVLQASVVYLLPGALTGFLIALVSGRFIDRFGARPVLVVAAVAGIAGFLFIAFAHSQPWQVIVASILANAYISLGYGALPALVVSEVDAGETGVATSMNAIARTVGSSTAAALVAVLLSRLVAGAGVPMESSFFAIFIGGAATAALAMVLIALSRPGAPESGIRRGALRNPRHEPRMGLELAQGGQIRHGPAHVGLEHLGDQVADRVLSRPPVRSAITWKTEPEATSDDARASPSRTGAARCGSPACRCRPTRSPWARRSG